MAEPIDLEMLSNDIAELLSDRFDEYKIDVIGADVRRAIVPFIDAIAPDRLSPEQRFGIGG
jgi:hypothetical protein